MGTRTRETDTARRAQRLVTVQVVGRFDGSTVPLVRSALRQAVEDSDGDVLLDISGVDWIDIPALALLADTQRRLRGRGRRLQLRGCEPRVRRALAVTRLNRVIAIERARRLAA
ncbi:MAG: STAS domain-containing protein [Nocardioidaceae bacterium]|nr:STAS domain-containing protein [Nocardioidaceae bacterium]